MQNLTLEQMIRRAEGKVCKKGLQELKSKNYKTLAEALGDPNAPEWSYLYARTVLKGPFPQGEDAIATSAVWSYRYARDVLKGPFPQGEDAIATVAYWSYKYARDILNDPKPDTWTKK